METLLEIDVAAADDRKLVETAQTLAHALEAGDFRVIDLSDLGDGGRRINVRVVRATGDAAGSVNPETKGRDG